MQAVHVAVQDFAVIGHDRAVVEIVRGVALVVIIRKAGIEHCVHTLLQQALHVAVHQLGRIACRIGGNGVLTLRIDPFVGKARHLDLKAQFAENGMPHGRQFEDAQRHGDADGVRPFAPIRLEL